MKQVTGRLVRELAPVARRAQRSVYNTPDAALHVGRVLLSWILAWPHQTDLSVRSYVSRRAANEARKLRAMLPERRRAYYELARVRSVRAVKADFPNTDNEVGA